MRRLACLTSAALVAAMAAGGAAAMEVPSWHIPTAVKKLPNGLTVVVSEDHSAPTFGISVAYGVGFRLEPQGRTGFAHLFEHMMFEGTPNSPKGVYSRVVEGGGGVDNGSTRFDYTNYIATAPVSALEPILWLEADRMRTLDFSEENLANQQDVVKEEIRVNVKNRPYGLFFWTDLGALIFDKWANAHDGYGSFEDLDAAKIEDVKAFHKSYYAPNNAVVGICGDVEPEEVFKLAEKYFGTVPAQAPPPKSDIAEKLNTAERTASQSDPFAQVPGLALGWKMPPPTSRDYLPGAVLGELLLSGDASRFYQRFVKGSETLLQVVGGVNWPLGDFLTNNGPTLMVVFALYKPNTTAKQVVDAMQAEIAGIAEKGVEADDLERTKVKMLSDFFASMELPIFRADTLAIRQLFTGDAATINDVPAQIAAVTADDVKRFAATYLTTANRAWIDRQPGGAPAAEPASEGGTS